MKKVFKVALVAVSLILVSTGIYAQFSANVGYVSTTSSIDGSDALPGITAGIGYDMEVQGGVGLSWGLNYTYAWDKEEGSFFGVTGTSTSKDHYLDIPVRLTYSYPVSDAIKVFGFAGPKFVYAVAGQNTYKLSSSIGSTSNDPVDHYKDTNLSRFDIKAGLGAGISFNAITLKGGYDWGLLNQNKFYGSDKIEHILVKDDVLKSNHFYVTLGYAF